MYMYIYIYIDRLVSLLVRFDLLKSHQYGFAPVTVNDVDRM